MTDDGAVFQLEGAAGQASQRGERLFARVLPVPERPLPRNAVEPLQVDQADNRLVMVSADNGGAARKDFPRAFVRIGSIADDVPKTPDPVHRQARDSLQHRIQGFLVAVDVADDRGDHCPPRGGSRG